jgi:hypothetical protein
VLPTTGERAPGGVRCRFEGEEPEPGVVGTPICGLNALDHVVPCHFAEEGVAPESGDVCIWEHGMIMAVSNGDFAAGRVGDPPPVHEGEGHEGGEHGEHAEGAEHGE